MDYKRNTFWIGLAITIAIAGCNDSGSVDRVEPIIGHIKAHFAPDSRVARFDVKATSSGDKLVLTGETTWPQAKNALLDSLSARNIAVEDSIVVLPSSDLGEQTFGLINNSVGNIRSEPGHPAQLVTQALLGMPLKILKRKGGWYLVQTPEDYLGWIDGGGLKRMDGSQYEEWKNADKLMYTNTYGFSYQKPSGSAGKVTDLVAGNILQYRSRQGEFYKVSYPDGRIGYVAIDEAKPFGEWVHKTKASQISLVQTGKTMMGAPYLWGGTSTKGIDCSGFTKTIYFMNGWVIPRDASQQVKAGVLVDDQKNFGKLEPGDLLFFGHKAHGDRPRRVSHVGMWIGNNEFIHSSGQVHISSVDSTASNFDLGNLSRYLEARRYLGNWKGNIIQTATIYELKDSKSDGIKKK